MSVDDLKKLNKNKKLVKNLAQKYDGFVASQVWGSLGPAGCMIRSRSRR